ncbi:MAG: histidine phosphatase family protein [Alphaproteobacteria bacterium]
MSWRDHTLYFIRHGETEWNALRKLQGSTDIPLNDIGKAQAARHGATLAGLDEDWSRFDFVASPMSRTRQTVDIVAGHLNGAGRQVHFEPRLREIEFGSWEGRTWSDIEREDPRDYDIFFNRGWNQAPHGGESYGDVSARVADWLETVTRDTVIVSHGGVSRVLRGLYQDLEANIIATLPTPQTTFFRFRDGQVDRI